MHVFLQAFSTWLNEPLKAFVSKHIPEATFYHDFDNFPKDVRPVFLFCEGCDLNEKFACLNSAGTGLINAYPNSDALSRKNHLWRTVEYWTAKRPNSILKTHCPPTVCLSLDYAEFVDESLTAADDLSLLHSLEENEDKAPEQREWWILKPALVDSGAGIRLFSTQEELASYLELAEIEVDDEETESGNNSAEKEVEPNSTPTTNSEPEYANEVNPSLAFTGLNSLDGLVTELGKPEKDAAQHTNGDAKRKYVFTEGGRIPSSEMREFVAQRYITAIAPLDKRKWHVRAYVLSMGRLKVYIYREMLALLASDDYGSPWLNPSLKASLSNTSLQDEDDFMTKESMRDFWGAPDDLLPNGQEGKGSWKEDVFDQICEISSELFQAAAHTMADKFTALDKCFELYGVDFLVDAQGTAWLLEVNETPAIYQQGVAGSLALRLMESVVLRAAEHIGRLRLSDEQSRDARSRMIEVLDETDHLAKSSTTNIMTE